MSKHLYLDCFAGISGDMFLGALVDAGADFDKLKSDLSSLGLDDEFEVTREQVVTRGITATRVEVAEKHHHHHDHDHGHSHGHSHSHGRSFTDISKLITQSSLKDSVKDRAIAIFRRVGEAEAKIHNKSLEEIHFHEVGAIDSVVDIVGASILIDNIGAEKIVCSPMPTFHGYIEIAHGRFPLPAPATAEILKGVPWRTCGIEGELVTPTGAAIVAECATGFGDMPEMSVDAIGYGAGRNDYGIPNVLRAVVGMASSDTRSKADVVLVETNIDDMNPQHYESTMEGLFDAGALDVYITPVQMKKNRPSVLLTAVCPPDIAEKIATVIFENTTAIGVRIDERKRICLERKIEKVSTPYGEISVKTALRDGRTVNAQPEYEDCKRAANEHTVPLKIVRDAAMAAYLNK